MPKYFSEDHRRYLTMLLLSLTGVFALFLLESHVGLTLWDEGFLWYGAQRAMVGEVPMRDFMAYDIGRYYWSAAFMHLWGSNGIVALRFAIAVFQAIALYIGLSALARNSTKQNLLFWFLATTILLAWLAPQFRVFDIALPIILAGTLSFLVEQPSNRRYFLTGVVIGLTAIFGRNHGLYGVLGSLGVMAYLAVGREGGASPMKAFSYWVSGIIAGYLPMLVFLVVVPGFAQAFWESIRVLFEAQSTNIPLPVPWPWLVPFGQLTAIEIMRGLALGMFFIAIVVFGVIGMVWVIRKKLKGEPVSATLIASIFLTLPYAHYAYSRADIFHLAPGIPPFLMGVLALLVMQSAKAKWLLTGLLCGVSLLVMLPTHSAWYCNAICIETDIAGDKLKVDQEMVTNMEVLTELSDQYAPRGRTFLVTPTWPGAYAALGRKSPMWQSYYSFSTPTASMQQAEVNRIKIADPGFVVIHDFALDGRDDMRFRNTHPLIYQYIRDNFEPLNEYNNPEFKIYKSGEQ